MGINISNIPQDPDSLIKFFILLAVSSESDLGFDTNIESVDGTDMMLKFTIDGRKYTTSEVLYDIGADAPTGRGSRVFEAKDEETEEVRIIKDCWIEDREGKQMEHEVVAGIKRDMGNCQKFGEHFVDICGHHKTDTSGGLGRICTILKKTTFDAEKEFQPLLLVCPLAPKPVYVEGAEVAHQGQYLKPTPTKLPPKRPPHPRFRYQVVYSEKGISLYEVTSFGEVFKYISQATEGT